MTAQVTSLFPAEFFNTPAFSSSGVPDWLWRPKDLEKGESARLYLASQPSCGYFYFTENKEVRLSQEFPHNYKEDIGYKYGHGPDVIDRNGKPLNERATPSKSALFRIWHVELGRMMAAVISSVPLCQQIDQIYSNPEFKLDEKAGIANFYLQITHNAKPSSPVLTYSAIGFHRPPQHPAVFAAASAPWYPEQYWLGLNPFEAPADQSLPPETGEARLMRDQHGADQDLTVPSTSQVLW